MTYVGIDVSKATFVVAYSSAKAGKTKTFKNTTKGVHEFIQTLSVTEHHCVLEATGNYSALLVYLLSKAGITVSLENPLKIKNFARVMLSVNKTDETDARLSLSMVRGCSHRLTSSAASPFSSSSRNGQYYASLKNNLWLHGTSKARWKSFLFLTLNVSKRLKKQSLSLKSR